MCIDEPSNNKHDDKCTGVSPTGQVGHNPLPIDEPPPDLPCAPYVACAILSERCVANGARYVPCLLTVLRGLCASRTCLHLEFVLVTTLVMVCVRCGLARKTDTLLSVSFCGGTARLKSRCEDLWGDGIIGRPQAPHPFTSLGINFLAVSVAE